MSFYAMFIISDTIVGLAAGGGLLLVSVSFIIVAILLRHRRRNKKENKIPKETLTTFTEHTNNGYEYEHNLPDNPLYHSSQHADEVGYSTVEEQKPSLPDPTMNDSYQTPNIYDTPVKRETANDRDTKQEQPLYATPKKNQSIPVNYTGGDMYAQVNKPNKNAKNSPVRTQNQDGLVNMEVDHSRDLNNENSPYTNDYSSETVAYAEVKTK
ncbi:uncharacterized protein LOC134245512 [Saccostrea cucullata]|uniref:uncharacterized protein LOC134245512 n=1 Tax=Saccostrea cuccullata TaxID=36930 RepID=UPI002ED3557F